MANLPVITYKAIDSVIKTDGAQDITEVLFKNVKTVYSNTVQFGEVEADYKCTSEEVEESIFKLAMNDKRIVKIDYVIPSEIIREFNPEQYMLVEKQMLADTFSIDPANISILVDGNPAPDSTFE